MSLTKIGSIGINTGIQLAGVTTVSTLLVGSGVTLSSDGDVFATGISTFSEDIKVGSGVTISPDGDGFYTGVVTATTFSGSAANLTNLPAANITGTLPAISGANLTNLDASDLASGTVPTARLGSGTASSSTFLRGDSTFAVVTSTTINNNADNRLITGSGTADTLEGESALTFDGNTLTISAPSNDTPFVVDTASTNGAHLRFQKDGSNQHFVGAGGGFSLGDREDLSLRAYDNILFASGNSSTERVRIDSSGRIGINEASPDSMLHISADSATAQVRLQRSNSASNTNDYGRIYFESNSNVLTGQISVARESGEDNGYMHFKTANSGTLYERLRITSDGRVGINRTPGLAYSKLEVGGTDNYPLINVEASGATGGMGIGSGILRLYYGTVSRLNITDSTALVSASNFGASGYVRSSGPGGGSGIKLQGLAAGSGSNAVDTGISVNQGNAGGTMIVIGCRNTGAGTATQGYAWLLKFHYDGNTLPAEYNITGTGSFWSLSLSGSNTLQINGNSGNWQFGGIWVT